MMCRSLFWLALWSLLSTSSSCWSGVAHAWVLPRPAGATRGLTTSSSSGSTSSLFLFNKLGDAFKNDDSLGKTNVNPGLKNGPNLNTQVTVNGQPVPNAVVGQKLTVVASKVRVKIPVNCQKGDCGTCMVQLNGKKVKACQTPLPTGKAVIQTLS